MINGKTILLCLLGSPVEHSFSPTMHNAAFEKLNINASYLAFDIKTEQIKTTLEGLKAMNFQGCNVTSPHKVDVMPCLDVIDEKAKLIGAVNTVVNSAGVLKGYNTDVDGFIESLIKRDIPLERKKIAVLGTGGASKAIVIGLLYEGAFVDVYSRELDKSSSFVNEIPLNGLTAKTYDAISSTPYDMIVNCTPIGMHPYEGRSPVEVGGIGHAETVFYDLIYNPAETAFLEQARLSGRRTVNGLDMLIYQGIYALKYWFEAVDIDKCWTRNDVLEILMANNIVKS